VLAVDKAGNLRYPKLYSLWQAVASSGVLVYIDLANQHGSKSDICLKAGEVIVEQLDQNGKVTAATVRLYSYIIDHTKSDPWDDGFVPFKGLGRDCRYLEILGHELAHTAAALCNRDYARRLQDLKKAADDFVQFRRSHWNMPQATEEMQRRANRIEILTTEVEAPARAAEVEVWRELVRGQSGFTHCRSQLQPCRCRVARRYTQF
jgi:hypothetical protein